jgi:hypothetical protein
MKGGYNEQFCSERKEGYMYQKHHWRLSSVTACGNTKLWSTHFFYTVSPKVKSLVKKEDRRLRALFYQCPTTRACTTSCALNCTYCLLHCRRDNYMVLYGQRDGQVPKSEHCALNCTYYLLHYRRDNYMVLYGQRDGQVPKSEH